MSQNKKSSSITQPISLLLSHLPSIKFILCFIFKFKCNENNTGIYNKCNIFLKCLQKMKRIFSKIDFNFLIVCLQWKEANTQTCKGFPMKKINFKYCVVLAYL
ncbi:hypothetical protein T07_7373 [Trichinella nelsoni]|uniref:Uncharacterized protein n=1 Tax=Trichinella nelsoni TaxID=6336 RepID=A0A0V0RN27_9BILA|nr:hypothetical protein T07_7373 [Trichinella nelsoni]